MAMYMFHFTRDGEYEDGVALVENLGRSRDYMQKLAATFEGCQVWAVENQWYSMPAAGLAYARWEPELESTVPECVRVAELLRGE